jgi:GT2 family glycosyltransferase
MPDPPQNDEESCQNPQPPSVRVEVAPGPRDIANCFNLFLGRMPSLSAPDSFAINDLSLLLRDTLQSDEFQKVVLQPLLLREELPHNIKFEDAPPLPLIDWAQRRLPIGESTRRILGGSRTWSQVLEVLLADAEFLALAPQLAEVGIDRILRERLDSEPLVKVRRSVVGAIDATSAFEVRGWAIDLCDKSVPVRLEFFADNLFIGSVVCSEARPDVQDVVGGDGQCGFSFRISNAHRPSFGAGRKLIAIDAVSREPVGTGVIVYSDAAQNWDAITETRRELAQLREALARIEARLPELGRMASVPIQAFDEYWERFYRPLPDVLAEQRSRSAYLSYRPLISVILPTWNSNTRLLDKAIASVRAQTYDRWELVISDDASGTDELKMMLERHAAEERIRRIEASVRGGIAVNTNRGIAAAHGEYIAFLDHDDELSPDALYYIALALQEREYGLLYSDEDRIEEDEFGRCVHHTPHFKAAFDPDLLRALNYMCHLVVVRADAMAAIGGLRSGLEGAQDHDLLLRAAAYLSSRDILHLPRVLYHWRVTPGSVSGTAAGAEDIQKNTVVAVEDQLRSLNLSARVEFHTDPAGSARQFATRVRWTLPVPAPQFSIILPTRDRLDLLGPCLDSLVDSLAAYPGRCEIIVVDNDSVEPSTLAYFAGLSAMPQIRVLRFRGPFNWSAINNFAAREATGEVLVFLNNDTVVISKDWMVELVANALRQDVGAVGARLLYADGTIQHAGVILGIEGVAGHECVGDAPEAAGYFGRSKLLRSTAAVTGACMATRRGIFEELGGFDSLNLKVAFNDVDYCMKVRKAGYRIVYNPFATLYHLESKSRGRELSQAQQTRHRAEAIFFRSRWSEADMTDPYYNLHFERFARPFDRLRPPPDI